MKQEIPWNRFAVEAIVIVGSILLAFAIDAWWEDRNDEAQRTAILQALGRDLERMRIEVDSVMESYIAGRDATVELLSMRIQEPLLPDQAMAVDSLLIDVRAAPSYDASSGALQALLGSGDLQLLDDPALLLDLLSIPALVNDLDREQGLLSSVLFELLAYFRVVGVDASDLNADTEVPWETRSDKRLYFSCRSKA